MVDKNPASVAQFLRHTPDLDQVDMVLYFFIVSVIFFNLLESYFQAMIGDYFGQHEEFPVAVMHAYVESINFSGMKLDIAIHEFLKGFELPGEAQMIDRIMEKFAER